MDMVTSYSTTRVQLTELAATLDAAAAATPVAATPGWSVKDVYSHLCGLCRDVLAGNVTGGDAWTATQVGDRADMTLLEVSAEWAEHGPELDAFIAGQDASRTMFIALDAWTHQQDVRSTVGVPRAVDDPRVAFLADLACDVFDRRLREAGTPALRIVHDGRPSALGEGGAAATLTVDDFELLRLLSGRRTEGEIRAQHWDGDPGPYVDHLHLFPCPVAPLPD
jgi:uncharacterized protein (TIGR03083 family)